MEEQQTNEWKQAYYNALREFWKRVFCIRPYRSGKLYFAEKCDIAIKLNKVKVPYLGESYSETIRSDIEMNILRIMRSK